MRKISTLYVLTLPKTGVTIDTVRVNKTRPTTFAEVLRLICRYLFFRLGYKLLSVLPQSSWRYFVSNQKSLGPPIWAALFVAT